MNIFASINTKTTRNGRRWAVKKFSIFDVLWSFHHQRIYLIPGFKNLEVSGVRPLFSASRPRVPYRQWQPRPSGERPMASNRPRRPSEVSNSSSENKRKRRRTGRQIKMGYRKSLTTPPLSLLRRQPTTSPLKLWLMNS